MGWQRSGRLFNPQLLLYRTANSDWKVTHDRVLNGKAEYFMEGKQLELREEKLQDEIRM